MYNTPNMDTMLIIIIIYIIAIYMVSNHKGNILKGKLNYKINL